MSAVVMEPHSVPNSKPNSQPSSGRTVNTEECLVCKKKFKDPRILQCGHHFCVRCLEGIEEHGFVGCPDCHYVTAMAGRKVVELPKHRLADDQRNKITNFLDMHQERGKFCDLCKSSKKVATGRCVECKKNFCKQCDKKHHSLEDVVSGCHRTIPYDEEKPPTGKCPTHPSGEAAMYCQDCMQLVCTTCIMGKHQHHQFLNIRDRAAQDRKVIQEFVQSLETLKYGKELVLSIKSKILEARGMRMDIRESVCKIRSIISSLSTDLDGAQNEAEAKISEEIKKLETLEADVVSYTAVRDNLLGHCTQLLKQTDAMLVGQETNLVMGHGITTIEDVFHKTVELLAMSDAYYKCSNALETISDNCHVKLKLMQMPDICVPTSERDAISSETGELYCRVLPKKNTPSSSAIESTSVAPQGSGSFVNTYPTDTTNSYGFSSATNSLKGTGPNSPSVQSHSSDFFLLNQIPTSGGSTTLKRSESMPGKRHTGTHTGSLRSASVLETGTSGQRDSQIRNLLQDTTAPCASATPPLGKMQEWHKVALSMTICGVTFDRQEQRLVVRTQDETGPIKLYEYTGRLLGELCGGVKELSYPGDIAVDSLRGLYLAPSQGALLLLDREGVRRGRVAVGSNLRGVDYSEGGDLYAVTDIEKHRLYLISADNHQVSAQIGTRGSGPSQFYGPYNVHCACVPGFNHVIVVSDCNNHSLKLFDTRGNHLACYGRRGKKDGQLHNPWGVASDGCGRLVVSDNNRVAAFWRESRLERWSCLLSNKKLGVRPEFIAVDPTLGLLAVCINSTVVLYKNYS